MEIRKGETVKAYVFIEVSTMRKPSAGATEEMVRRSLVGARRGWPW